VEYTWDLSSLFTSDEAWEETFSQWQSLFSRYDPYRGKLAQSPGTLAECLRLDSHVERMGERLGAYAYLKAAEDQTNNTYQRLLGRYRAAATQAGEKSSFIRPEILAIPASRMNRFLRDPLLAPYRLLLERLLRYRPYTLSDKEERLLAMQGDMASALPRSFRQLHDADLKFGYVRDERGRRIQLTNATFTQLLHSPSRAVRRRAFHQYYAQFAGHKHVLASLLFGSIQTDVYYAKVRGYPSALAQALFADDVPISVYDRLIQAVHEYLPALHRYYELRRRVMRLARIHHYDTYAPLLPQWQRQVAWENAVEMILSALRPLGDDYVNVLRQGFQQRWCDRYPNAGKQSGAFSYGTYDAHPYILINYRPTVFDDVFTLAHEAGHSMHSYLSARHQPFEYYHYTIFVAEVASTFNEELLLHFLLQQAQSEEERAYLISRELDAIRTTIYRQTMFAEFEKITHELAEAGEPLTEELFTKKYRELLERYFGPEFTLDEELALECFRIPHFYRAFYVYKYATGMSAAIALSQRVLQGGAAEREAYLNFLKAGCTKFPLDLLRDAGVDMADAQPVRDALRYFEKLVEQLEQLLGRRRASVGR
jgi:oligoendopeptidase F